MYQNSNTARAVLRAEAGAILSVEPVLDSQAFQMLAGHLTVTAHKLIVTGIGKSAIAARKIAATLATCDLVSVFVDPVGLFHGELGLIRPNDAVLMVSQSGETEELVRLISVLERKGVFVYSLVGRNESTLARHTCALVTGVTEEPFLKLPTASSAAAVAIGDALAAEVAQRKGYDSRKFLANHPGGHIGRTLSG